MPIDLNRLRADALACARMIHFNNAVASLQPRSVTEAVGANLAREQEIGCHEPEGETADALDSFFTRFADLLGATRLEIAYVEIAPRAWDIAFYQLPRRERDHILKHSSD